MNEIPVLPPGVAEALRTAGFEFVVAATGTVWILREGCAAIAQVTPAGLGTPGSTGLMTEQGFGFLVWREGQAYVVAKGSDVPATKAQLELVRKFSEGLKAALG